MMDPETSEYDLALRAREGDREALAELVERTRLRLFALAYAELRHYEDAQDAVAAALLQICRHVKELREPERVRAWMQSIVRHEVHRLRRGASASLVPLEVAPEPLDGAQPSLLRLDIARALRQLPGDQARAIQMYYLDELSVREIGQRLGRAEGTITSWLHRGRRNLAAQMEDYAPMTPSPTDTTRAAEPSRTAALIHNGLDPALIQQVMEALQAGGYAPQIVTPGELPRLLESLSEYEYLVLDETIGGRSALELLINMRANPETRLIPVCVLCSQLLEFTASAYFCVGADRLVRKEDAHTMAALGEPITRNTDGWKRLYDRWRHLTERTRRVLFYAREEAARRGEEYVGTEHLLLGLIRESDSAGARVLTERLGVSLERIRNEVEQQATNRPIQVMEQFELTPRARRALELAEEEAQRLDHNYLSTEHLLLGLIREGEGLAAKVLTELGADLESARQAVQAMQSG
jgi:RNA polymerase sigma factor (sigma-70 family)